MLARKDRSRRTKGGLRRRKGATVGHENGITSHPVFRLLLGLLLAGLLIQLGIVLYHDEITQKNTGEDETQNVGVRGMAEKLDAYVAEESEEAASGPPHLFPVLKPLPAHAPIENADKLIRDTMNGEPTIVGIVAILQTFLKSLHGKFKELADQGVEDGFKLRDQVLNAYLDLSKETLLPFDAAYRGKPIFEIREDESIFISIAAYRDHLLGETMRLAFTNAAHPERLFVGAVVQNCFGIDSTCRTGVQVVGKNANGQPITKVSDAPPDKNGVEDFCTDENFKKYCDSGQVRALYVNETESLGPAVARYYASKLWGGESYYMQVDAHLQFAPHWDQLYIDDLKLTSAFPKAILSAYPPGFTSHNALGTTPGARLCTCVFSPSDVEHQIIRINTGANYRGDEERPTQIAFIAAGFFFARAEFLVDVPFDPLLPWAFMGEEIALSMRAWTAGWDIYAPRKNLITHQYRPGRMGLPKFWETVGRTFHRPGPGFNTKLQTVTIHRIKNMVGYAESSREVLEKAGNEIVLADLEYYSMGKERTREEYLEFTKIDVDKRKCGNIQWCNRGELE